MELNRSLSWLKKIHYFYYKVEKKIIRKSVRYYKVQKKLLQSVNHYRVCQEGYFKVCGVFQSPKSAKNLLLSATTEDYFEEKILF